MQKWRVIDMTIDEAISECKENDLYQIAEWLEELKTYKSLAPRDLVSEKQKNDRAIEYSKGFDSGLKTGYSKALDDFVNFANTMPTVEEEDGEIRPMWLEEMAEQLRIRKMNRKNEIEKYLMPLLSEEPEEITATALQREYTNGFLAGQKKAYEECDEVARELSQIKSGCSKWLDKHDANVRAYTIDNFVKEFSLELSESIIWGMIADCFKYKNLNDTSDKIADYAIDTVKKIAEQLKEKKSEKC